MNTKIFLNFDREMEIIACDLKEVAEKLQNNYLLPDERRGYERFRENCWIKKDVLQTAEKLGEEKAQIKIAIKLIEIGQSNEMIREVTKLTIEQIEDLRSGKDISNFSENRNEVVTTIPKKRKKL
jgi:hypothetical protein